MTGTSRGQAPSWKTEQSSWPLLKLMRETSKRFTTTAILWKKKFAPIMITTLMRTTSKRYNTHILWRKKAFIFDCTFLRQDKYRENCQFIRTSIIHSPLHKSNEINPVLSQTGALCVKSEISYCGNCHIAKHIYQHWKAASKYSWRLVLTNLKRKSSWKRGIPDKSIFAIFSTRTTLKFGIGEKEKCLTVEWRQGPPCY